MQPLLLLGTTLALTVSCRGHGPSGERELPRLVQAPGSPIAVGPDVGRPVLADLDGDGALDLLVPHGPTERDNAERDTERDDAGHNPAERDTAERVSVEPGRVSVLRGRGDGTFHAARVTRLPRGGSKLAAGDVDGDGRLDGLLASHDSYSVAVLRGDGRGGLRHAGEVRARDGERPHTHALLLEDVNGDGHVDLCTTNADDGDVSVLLGDGAGDFRPAPGSPFAAGRHPYEGLRACDVDGDGALDLVVADLHGSAVVVLRGDGRGGFAPAPGSPHAVASRPGMVAAGDLDGDGRTDVVATHDGEPLLSVLRGREGGFGPARRVRLDEPAWDARVVDLDGDGRVEVVLGGVESDVLVLGAEPGEPFPARRARVRAVGRAPGYLAVGDVDGDGRLDVVTGNLSGGDVSVLLARPR